MASSHKQLALLTTPGHELAKSCIVMQGNKRCQRKRALAASKITPHLQEEYDELLDALTFCRTQQTDEERQVKTQRFAEHHVCRDCATDGKTPLVAAEMLREIIEVDVPRPTKRRWLNRHPAQNGTSSPTAGQTQPLLSSQSGSTTTTDQDLVDQIIDDVANEHDEHDDHVPRDETSTAGGSALGYEETEAITTLQYGDGFCADNVATDGDDTLSVSETSTLRGDTESNRQEVEMSDVAETAAQVESLAHTAAGQQTLPTWTTAASIDSSTPMNDSEFGDREVDRKDTSSTSKVSQTCSEEVQEEIGRTSTSLQSREVDTMQSQSSSIPLAANDRPPTPPQTPQLSRSRASPISTDAGTKNTKGTLERVTPVSRFTVSRHPPAHGRRK